MEIAIVDLVSACGELYGDASEFSKVSCVVKTQCLSPSRYMAQVLMRDVASSVNAFAICVGELLIRTCDNGVGDVS